MTSRSIGVAHLTALELPPPEFIERAARAGFGSVGVRVHPSTATETRYPMLPPSPMLDATAAALKATGTTVLDIEVFGLAPELGPETWLPILEAGAAIGATVLNVVGADPEPARFIDKLGALVRDAAPYGIRPSLEQISYQHVSTLALARRIAEETGAGLMLDALHLARAGTPLAELRALPPQLVSVIQLCDGPLAEPDFDGEGIALPIGQSTARSPRQFEARARRGLPGTGQFPLREILAAFPEAPLSVEVPDIFAVRESGLDDHLAACFAATSALVADLRK